MTDWRTIPGLPFYEASSDGQIRSVDRDRTDSLGRVQFLPSQVITPQKTRPNGKYVSLWLKLQTPTGRKSFYISQLILLTFKGPSPPGMEACHNDGNSQNNAAYNLRWDTHLANMKDADRHGTRKSWRNGRHHWKAKITEDDARAIRLARAGENRVPFKALAARYGICLSNVEAIVYGRYWKQATI